MPLTTEQLLLLWAKSPRGKADQTAYHPLLCHMIDVAMVARAMWSEVLTPALRRSLADGLGLSEEDAGVWIAFLAGLHDIGKASPAFQSKWKSAREILKRVGLDWFAAADCPHGQVSSAILRPMLERRGRPEKIALVLAAAIGGHHGVIPGEGVIDTARKAIPRDRVLWKESHEILAANLADVLGVGQIAGPTTINHSTAMVVAGLVSVADWIGSDEGFFNYKGTPDTGSGFDTAAYARHAGDQAHAALAQLGWLGWKPATMSLTFDELFPDFAGRQRPVQQRIVELPGIIDAPGIVIVELPMGEGKTEAALLLADRWLVNLKQSGLYIGMPTMATSDQMFTRTHAYLTHRYPDDVINLQRMHSHAALWMDQEAEESGKEADSSPVNVADNDRDREANDAKTAVWFTRRKRGLLAPFGVGTVDQALLAALQTKHVFVRLFGLAGKTIIFDEVHAYDVYMSTLFERLLEWLGALGCSVIILSATLPNARREALLRAYARGAGRQIEGDITHASYPRLSWFGAAGADAEFVPASPQAERELRIEWIDDRQAALSAYLQERLRDGGCAAVICNTVGRAQEAYAALKKDFPGLASDGEPILDLFHARYLFKDRQIRQERAICRFGKPDNDGSESRPDKAILVATQVIEQSLDLDFDLMVSDLAPIDLLLQRSGRLQRHDRGPRTPILRIIRPESDEHGDPHFEKSDEYMYSEHVLLRTWLALQPYIGVPDRPIHIPGDVEELIEAVYAPERAAPIDQPETIRLRWDETRAEYDADEQKDALEAQHRWLGGPHDSGELAALVRNAREEDDPTLHTEFQALTRLTERNEPLICLRRIDERRAESLDGTETFDLTGTPNVATARRMLRHAVNITHRGFVREIDGTLPLRSQWKRSSLLQYHRLALLDDNESVRVRQWLLRIDGELGVQIGK